MFVLSAFADEIDPDPEVQIRVLRECRIRFIEFRSIHRTNVLDLTNVQIGDFKKLLERNGMALSAIGSPIGKVKIDEPFDSHWLRFERAIELAKFFETRNIRIFSFYPPDGATTDEWPKYRDEILRRLNRMAEWAAVSGIRLLHENEHRIYGDSPERVVDLLNNVKSPAFAALYDPANYVFCGYDPWDAWIKTRDRTVHFHIKDWVKGETHGRVAGEGQGRIRDVLADATARGYAGFATLEPHLLGGGPTGGVTGEKLFPKAVEALRNVMNEVGAVED